MKKVFMRRAAVLVVTAIAGIYSAGAQSIQDLGMLKSLAQSYGYSDYEIQQLIQGQGSGLSSMLGGQSTVQSVTSDRNLMSSSLALQNSSAQQTVSQTALAQLMDSTLAAADTLSERIFGHRLFKSPSLNFIPNYNIPTPASYKLAPGDEIVVDIWGATSMNYRLGINPDGTVQIDGVGPVYLTGYTLKEAEAAVRKKLETLYSGLGGDNPDSYMKLSLGLIRSLSVNVVGDAVTPGTYTLPSLATAFTALYLAGGPTELGSLRDVRLYRNGDLVEAIDFYDFIINGVFNDNLKLQDNDLIIVSPYGAMVEVKGCVKRPMLYEVKAGESIADLMEFCAGYTSEADRTLIHVERRAGERTKSFDITASDFSSFILMDGDVVTVPENISRPLNSVYLDGAVWHPGYYSISDEVKTLRALIDFAGGLKDEAYMERGFIERIDSDRDTLSINFNLADVMEGIQDIPLVNEDRVRIFAKDEFNVWYPVYTQGEFNRPGTLDYREGMTLGDAVMLSGGFAIGASRTNVDVARRNFCHGKYKGDTVSIVYTFDLNENPDAMDFKLRPYDMISVRTAPNYRAQQVVNITGEVNFPGYYVVEKSTVRLSDIVSRAGGHSNDAYLEGATLYREMTEQEYQRALLARVLAAEEAGVDTADIEMPRRNQRYSVAIDMEKALKNPGSPYDIVLSGNDSIAIPKYNSTVRISGAVLMPNVVTFDPSYSVRQYIKLAGGYTRGAIKSQKYIVFMNGSAAAKGSRNFKPRPGCEIIVPQREVQRRRISAAEVLSIASSTTSVAAMVVTMVNQLR
ncbi:MAG TPA: SLBB domain-containing protein [Candidatus Coprenecus stercoravium]|uniref:SLBB domain-containing protein n=1 Tax=Candidatus Coprenecus stercoravium TaxID=2840735 RepID=A0A9D2GRX9_9BACT|nr:SLBB domain-containing protein [Candidatus Coprenecus stercoravium]